MNVYDGKCQGTELNFPEGPDLFMTGARGPGIFAKKYSL